MFQGYIQHLDPAHAGTLQYLYVSLSNICNARCSYCDVHSAPAPVRAFGQPELHAIFSDAQALGCRTVHFLGGGEPLVAPAFADAVAVCRALGLHLVITTNGSHLSKRLATVLSGAALDAVLVSLDSHEAPIHDDVRGLRRLWEKAVAGIRLVKTQHPSTRVILNHVMTTRNIGVVTAFLGWAASEGVDALNLIPVKDAPGLEASPAQSAHFAASLWGLRQQATDAGVELLCLAGDVDEWAAAHAGSTTGREYRCLFPEFALYIDFPTGSVFPCDCTVHRNPSTTFDLGNIWTSTLHDVWAGRPAQQLRSVLASPCDPGCKKDCDWNNMRTNEFLLTATP